MATIGCIQRARIELDLMIYQWQAYLLRSLSCISSYRMRVAMCTPRCAVNLDAPGGATAMLPAARSTLTAVGKDALQDRGPQGAANGKGHRGVHGLPRHGLLILKPLESARDRVQGKDDSGTSPKQRVCPQRVRLSQAVRSRRRLVRKMAPRIWGSRSKMGRTTMTESSCCVGADSTFAVHARPFRDGSI
jgi:hypothetical protein